MFKLPMKDEKAFSLVELIIAISLMGLIILAIVAVDVGSRGFLKTSDDESTLQNEANFIMESIVKDIGKSFKGAKNNPSVKSSSANTLEIRNRGTGESFELSNSQWVKYVFSGSTITKQSCATLSNDGEYTCTAWGSPQQLVKNIITNCVFNFDTDTSVVGITVTARAKPSEEPGQDNPEVILESSVSSRSISR